ncbi:MAG: hypothetical protein M1828_000982 [Chrysothrix sp. TS-e1954]|nr:MAG: hypothetical protein M1828_000982 [Chrysothrix sp. TS-e1954]
MPDQEDESSRQDPRKPEAPAAAEASARMAMPEGASTSSKLPPLRLSGRIQSFEDEYRPAPIEPRSLPQPSYNLNAFHTTAPRAMSSGMSTSRGPSQYNQAPYSSQYFNAQPPRAHPSSSWSMSSPALSQTGPPSSSGASLPEPASSALSDPREITSRTEEDLQKSNSGSHGCRLNIRQQPEAARACGFGERDRRVIDPPPVLELDVLDPSARPSNPDVSQFPMYIVHAELWNEAGTSNVTSFLQNDKKMAQRLIGQTVASPDECYDHQNRKGFFFTFADLSCREMGRYRLCFRLLRITRTDMQPGAHEPVLAAAYSTPFTVYSAKEFPGMQTSTALTKALKDQGVNIPAKKGKQRVPATKNELRHQRLESAED